MTTTTRSAREADVQPTQAQQYLARPPYGLWLWPALAALLLAVLRINVPQMDTDELVTWDVSRRGIGRIVATLHRVDAVHGTYYMLMHAWMALFGDSTTAMRLPSALAMSGATALVALIGHRLFGARAGICGGLLFALIPAVSRFGQEARSYALVVLVATLATFLLLRALDVPGRWGRWAAYALCVAVLGLLHLVALTVLLGHVTAAVVRARHERRALPHFCLAVLAGVVCVIPVIELGRSQANRQLFWVPRPDAWGPLSIWPQLFASSLCAGALLMLTMFAADKKHYEAVLLCTALAVLPPLAVWAASYGDTVSYFRYQYVLVTLPALAVLAGAGLAAATRSWKSVTGVLAVLTLLVLPEQLKLRQEYEHHQPLPTDYAGAARTIMKYYQHGDAVVYNRGIPWMLDQGVRYYLPRGVTMREVFLSASAAQNNELYPLYCPEPAKCLKREGRIWLVVPGNNADPLDTIPANQAQALRAKYTDYGTERLPGLTVALLLRKR